MSESARILELEKEVRELRAENALLRQKIDLLVRRIFGKSSEALSPDQLELLLGGEPESPAGKAAASWTLLEPQEAENHDFRQKTARRGARERWPEDLPVVEEVLEPEEVKADPGAWRRIGQEVSESLDYEPARFLRRRLVRPKYVARQVLDAVPVVAPLPASLRERGVAAPGLIAAVVVAKYADHLPLYRQEAIFKSRHGLTLPRASLARWVELAAEWLRPVYDAIGHEIRAGGYIQVDETPIRYLAPGHGQTKLGYLWTTCRPRDGNQKNPGDVLYRWETSRAARCLEAVIPVDFRGVIQCDGYAAYPSFARSRPEGAIALAGCWAHARRGFHEARDHAPQAAGWILRQIAALYRIEARLRRQRASPKLRAVARSAESAPILARIRSALLRWRTARRFLPKSTLGEALDYTLTHWTLLEAYLPDGRIDIDNNAVENSIRPTAIGKKNWLFIGAAQAGQRSAILYTLIESCRRRGLNPFDYLRDVLTRLPSMTNWQIKDLTPSAWAASRRAAPLRRAA